MTNLEWLIKGSYIEKYDDVKGDKLIINCESGKLKELSSANQCDVLKWLLQEHKEKIKITQFEYDLLLNCMEAIKENEKDNDVIGEWWIIKGMKEKGHFKNIEMGITFKEVLANCEIVTDDYEF